MPLSPAHLLFAILIGLGATALIDLWAILLRSQFSIPSLSMCLLGRWVLHMPNGTFVHASIGAAAPRSHECGVGWLAHYLIGVTFGLIFGLLAPAGWFEHPTLLPALGFGVVTVVIPLFVMQPALGLGFASAKSPKPMQARLKSLATHAVFGVGLYISAWLLSVSVFRG
ncbi:MAG: DUF2938 domain-containing protein [Gemmatimonadota bacterium]